MANVTVKMNVQALFDGMKDMCNLSDYEVYESEDFYVSQTDFKSTPMFNLVVGRKPLNVAAFLKLKEALKAPFLFAPLEAKFVPEKVVDALKENHIELADTVTASYFDDWDSFTLPDVPDSAYRIENVKTVSQMNDFDMISALCFHHERGLAAKFMRGLVMRGFQSERFQLYVGYLDKTPVNIGSTYQINKKLAANMWGATHPDYQKKGFASMMAAYRMHHLHQAGVETVMCQNMAVSKNIYQRLGFKNAGDFPLYVSADYLTQT